MLCAIKAKYNTILTSTIVLTVPIIDLNSYSLLSVRVNTEMYVRSSTFSRLASC